MDKLEAAKPGRDGTNVPTALKPILMLFYGIGKPRQPIFGTELSGEVEAVGNAVTTFKPGDAVFRMCSMKMGAHAEYITLPEKGVIANKPSTV